MQAPAGEIPHNALTEKLSGWLRTLSLASYVELSMDSTALKLRTQLISELDLSFRSGVDKHSAPTTSYQILESLSCHELAGRCKISPSYNKGNA